MGKNSLIKAAKDAVKAKIGKAILEPLDTMVTENISDITTTIGSFVIRSIRGKFQRSITFNIGLNYADRWMEEALYGILYDYNNIKAGSRLEITNKSGLYDGTGMYYRLDDGTHNLKYRNWNILLAIQTQTQPVTSGRTNVQRIYTIITYDLSPEFVTSFERDMLSHRNSLLKIRSDSPTVNVFQDYHESDGYTYWEKSSTINKRKLATIYLPMETKKKIVDTVNEFFGNKEYYQRHGIAHNLKILLYGPPGPQPLDVPIPTPTGFVNMGDINPGDEVLSFSGRPTIVEDIREYDDLDEYVITFSDGRTTRCADTHQWPIINQFGGITNTTTADIMKIGVMNIIPVDSYQPYSVNLDNVDIRIPGMMGAQYDYYPIPALNPWVLGVILTAGRFITVNNDLKIRMLCITVDNEEILNEFIRRSHWEKINNETNDLMNSKVNHFFMDREGNYITAEYFTMRYFGFDVPEDTDDIDMCTVEIPEEYMINSQGVRWMLIQGIMDMEGWIESSIAAGFDDGAFREEHVKTVHASLRSIELRNQLMRLLYSCGVSCRIIPVIEGDDSLDIVVTMPDLKTNYKLFYASKARYELEYDAYLHCVNKPRSCYDPNPYTIRIQSIAKTGRRCKMRCLHVEDEAHIYLTEGFVPTCNTGKDSIAKMIASEWNRNIYYVTGGKEGKFIPNAITDNDEDVNHPLLLISDIDKYPYLISEPDINMKDESAKDDKIKYKQIFGSMINALDGVLSAEGRIIVMTTNHIEKFSETFTRPGRVDLKLEIGYVTPEVLRKYVYDFYGVELPENIKLKSDKLTVAEMQFDVVFLKLTSDEFIAKHVKSK